jgi:hypothetical protein
VLCLPAMSWSPSLRLSRLLGAKGGAPWRLAAIGEGAPPPRHDGFSHRLLALTDLEKLSTETGGWGGIRTLETLARLPVFKTGAFNHSATHPCNQLSLLGKGQQNRNCNELQAAAPSLPLLRCAV